MFTPDNPNLYSLNLAASLIFELCHERNFQDLEDAYYEVVEPCVSRELAGREVRRSVEDLERKGIIEWVADKS